MGEPTGPFRRSDRLLDSRDFRRVSRHGRRVAGSHFVLLVAEPGPGADRSGRRIGVTASRRVGNAVVRNRVKRGVREWFRARRAGLPRGLDLVVIARRPASGLRGGALAESLDALVRRADLAASRGTGVRS